MLYPSSEIQWMAVPSAVVASTTIQEMFKRYSHKVQNVTSAIAEVTFGPEIDNIKIVDMYGWTELYSIQKTTGVSEWLEIHCETDRAIICNNHTTIPVYDPDNKSTEFHGRTVYSYEQRTADNLTSDCILRILRVRQSDPEFIKIKSIKQLDIISDGYTIQTKSRFFNANDIYFIR